LENQKENFVNMNQKPLKVGASLAAQDDLAKTPAITVTLQSTNGEWRAYCYNCVTFVIEKISPNADSTRSP
jgi:hypothetical protein